MLAQPVALVGDDLVTLLDTVRVKHIMYRRMLDRVCGSLQRSRCGLAVLETTFLKHVIRYFVELSKQAWPVRPLSVSAAERPAAGAPARYLFTWSSRLATPRTSTTILTQGCGRR
jgi:hypothetical protein